MEHRTKRDTALINLVSNFETNFEKGNVEYLDEKSYNQLVEYYEDEGNFEKALDVVSLALTQFEYRSDFYISMSRLLIKCNKIEKALDYLNNAENIAPYENEIFFLRSRAYAKKGDFELAFASLNTMTYLSKYDQVESLLCEAYIYEQMKSFSEMYASLNKVLKLDNENELALEKIVLAAQSAKKINECISFHRKLINKNPYNYLAWYNLGIAYTHQGEYERSIDALEYSYIINSSFEEGYMDCADICCQIKRYGQAADIYEETILVFGEDADLLANLSECLLEIGRSQEAKQKLYRAVKMDPYNDEVYFLLGECFTKEKKWYRAINAYHKAIEIEEDCENYYISLARAYLNVEEYNKATINFQLAISFGPEQTHFWAEFAALMIKLGLYEETIQVLDEAEDFSYGADLLYCRGVANLFLKEHDLAMENFEEALEENYAGYKLIFELAPELEVNKEITAMIKYYQGE